MSVPQHSPRSLAWCRAVERSLFELAEHRLAQRERDPESSRRLPESEFQAGQLVSPIAMAQRREVLSKCFGLPAPLVKRPAPQPAPQFVLAVGNLEPICRLNPGRSTARLPPLVKAGHQPPPRCATEVSAVLFSAAERLSAKGYRSDRIVSVGAQFSQGIGGSFP